MTGPSPGADLYARDREFWLLMGRAAVIGLAGGSAALAFTLIVRAGTDALWGSDLPTGWLTGEWWWVGLLALAGLVVGVMRMVWRVPLDIDGSLTILQDASVDRSTALPAIAISAVSLIGGSSLGPFDAATRGGAYIGDLFTDLRGLPESRREISVLSGINGALGGMLTAPVLATLFATELRWPERTRFFRILLPSLTASIAGFIIVFAVVGDTFLGVFSLPPYQVRAWHFLLAVGFGIVAAALSWLLGLTVFALRTWVMPHVPNQAVRGMIGGLALGIIAMALPLTLASGKSQLSTAIESMGALSAALLVAVVLAKIIAVAISLTSGFIGGPVMPTLFIGGAAGLAIHALFEGLPVAMVVSTMLVAVPAVSIRAPFTMVFLAALTVGVGAVETVPAAIAVVTAYVVTAGLGWFGIPQERIAVDISDLNPQSQLFEIGPDQAPGSDSED